MVRQRALTLLTLFLASSLLRFFASSLRSPSSFWLTGPCRDFLKERSEEEIRDVFERIGQRFSDDEFRQIFRRVRALLTPSIVCPPTFPPSCV